MGVIPKFVLGFYFFMPIATFHMQEGCFVRDKILETNIQFDTAEVTILKSTKENLNADILLNCDNRNYDQVFLKSGNVTLKRVRSSGVKDNLTYPMPDEIKHWTRFQLGLTGTLSLKDDDGKFWLPENLTIDCDITSVEFDKGYFVKHCPEGTPTWNLGNGTEREIPLQENVKIQRLALISRKPFSPVIGGGLSELTLGMANGKLTADQNEPLPPGLYQISLETLNKNNGYEVKVTKGDEENTLVVKFPDVLTKLTVKGKKKDEFVVVKCIEGTSRIYDGISSMNDILNCTSIPEDQTGGKYAFLIIATIIGATLGVQFLDLFLLLMPSLQNEDKSIK